MQTRKGVYTAILSVLVAFMMLATIPQPIVSMENGDIDSLDSAAQGSGVAPPGDAPVPGDASAHPKRALYKDIVVATADVRELAAFLEQYDYEGLIGTGQSSRRGIAFPVLSVPPEAIEGIASLPSVMGVYDYVEPVSTLDVDGTTFSRSLLGLGPNSPVLNSPLGEINAATLYHGAEEAWDNGFTGEGVKVATITSGTDFGNIELRGRQAVVNSDITIDNEVLQEPSSSPTDTAELSMSKFYTLLTCEIYVNGSLLASSGYTASGNGTITFDPPVEPGKWINASYTYRSPYYGYPIAFDPTSMASYISDGLQASTLNPGSSWYVNTSSTDLYIYHTVVVDGTNDFWAEKDPHGSSESVYDLNRTSEFRAEDPAKDITGLELDMRGLYTAADGDNWYFGFDVAPVTSSWTREYDVNYGLYIDTDGASNSGATTDPLGNHISTTSDHRPEYAIYFHHTGPDWGVKGTELRYYTPDRYAETWTDGILTYVDWGVNRTGVWSNNRSVAVDSVGDQPIIRDLSVWSRNDTIQNGTLYHWNGAGWDSFVITQETPYNDTVGIGVEAGSTMYLGGDGQKYVVHNGVDYRLLPNSTIFYNQSGYGYVGIEILTGQQAYGGDFVEFSLPKQMLPGVTGFHEILFSVGDNASHAQDSVPSDPAVAFEDPDWGGSTTQLSAFREIQPVPQYIVSGIPSASGDYRVGLHPDQNLMNQHYGRPVAVLVTDYYEPGVYNAVFVDLDNDKDFTDEIPAMERGAYNDTRMIGPRYGTTWDEKAGTITHNSTVYTIQTQKVDVNSYDVFNETLILGAAGGETSFALAHQNISVAPTLQRNTSTTTQVVNETSYITTAGDAGNDVTFYTANAPLLDISMYVFIPGDAVYPLDAGVDYTVNMATGEITTLLGGVDQDWEFYTYYNYSSPLIFNPTYTIDLANGTLVLDQPLAAGDDLIALNYTYEVTTITEVPPFINYPGANDICYIELRDWVINKDLDADGGTGDGKSYPDLSGGMVYFISDGKVPLPYEEVYWEWNAIEEENRRIPANGDLVAFFGEFDEASTQGTEIASAVSGEGNALDGNGNVLVKGMAPDATLISIRGGVFGSWYFAVEGYDGLVGTGDEAQIVAVTTAFPVSETGWDIYTKGAEYIGTYYAGGRTVFVAGTGDSGFGYGTTAAPGSSDATITVGQGTQFDYRRYDPGAPSALSRVYADKGPNPHHGDVLPSSGRGPSMLGDPEPDVITAGAFLFGATPLNADQDTFTPTEFDWYGGQWAWDLWSGSALSASSTAGILALIYDAYEDVNGEFPTTGEARSLLRSGADNLNYDVLAQGAGWCNADRSTRLAANMDGIYLDRTYWVPGDYRGVRYEGFVKLMEPGESATQTVTLENRNQTAPAEIQVYDAVFHKFGEYQIPINITRTYDDKNIPGVINIEPYIAVGTELLKVTVISQRPDTGGMQNYMAELFDWTDVNENGQLDFPTEQNRMEYVIGTNSLELRYRDPLGRVHDGLAVQVKGFGGSGAALDEWTIHLEFYEKVDWNWLSVSGAASSIPAGGSDSFDINLDIPADAGVGSYEGAVYITKKAPEELIATGVGLVKENVPFKLWFYPSSGAEGILNDNETTGGARAIVPGSTVIHWNGTTLYEGVDYDLSGTGGTVKFRKQYPAGAPIPAYAPYFNMTYLTVEASGGMPLYNATWSGQVSIPNLARGNVTVKKDGTIWTETDTVLNETVVASALGSEERASLAHRNIVRNTASLTLNGTDWPQDGGLQSETPVASAFAGQDYVQLVHGNVVPGSTEMSINGQAVAQTGEVTILEKEEVQGLNSTSTQVNNFALAELGADVGGSIWNDTGTWYGKLPVNSDDTPDFTIISYLIYEDGIPLTDGLDFQMHADGVHGKIQFSGYLDPGNKTYTVDYEYYNHTIQVGQLAHGQVISESYKLYRNGASMKTTEFTLDLTTGLVTMAEPLGPNEVIEAAYKFNRYLVETRTGNISLSDPLQAGDMVEVTYRFYNWTLDLATGVLEFADPLQAGDAVTADYSYANYTLDMMNGIVKFSNALLPGENVTCEYYHYSNVIPVFFNIGASRPDFEFGGPDPPGTQVGDYDELFKYNEIRGGYGGGGDWHYVYLDIMEQGRYALPVDNERLLVDVTWEYDLTDVDVQVYGGRLALPGAFSGWPYDPLPADEFGPHTVTHVGGSDVTSDFFTTSGGPEEVVAPKISAGLNVIGLHTVGMNGSAEPTEVFSAKVGTMYLNPTEVKVVTNQHVGSTRVEMTSNMEWQGVGGIAAGPSAPESLKDQDVYQDDPDWSNYDTFEEQLSTGSTVYSRTIKDCLIFDVHIWGHDNAPDLDLGVFLDGSGGGLLDGKVQPEEFVAYGADADADEQVKLIAPADGTYLIVVYGFSLTTVPAQFDMDITIVQGTGFDLQGKGVNSLPADQKGYFSSNQTEAPFNGTYLNLAWDLQGSATGTLQGALYIGPGNAPMCMLVPIELTIDTDAPEITAPTPSEGAYVSTSRPEIVASISDYERGELLPSTLEVHLDGMDVTAQSTISIPYIDDADANPQGYVAGTVAYTPSVPLDQGGHVVEVRILDKAGNLAVEKWAFTVDTTAPALEVNSPASQVTYTSQDTYHISGSVEPGADLRLSGTTADLLVSSDGTFTATVPVFDGVNEFKLTATDKAGNQVSVRRVIIQDKDMPGLGSVRFSGGFVTNQPVTTMTGSMSEPGTLTVNGAPVTVNADGSFSQMLELTEGQNTIHLEFSDMARNTQDAWYNVTLDTVAPILIISPVTPKITHTQDINLTGVVEPGSDVFINGKRAMVGTWLAGTFSASLTLSPGLNTIVIQAEDDAGNIAEIRHVVEYDPGTGTNWAAIGLMVALLVLGLVLGLLLGGMLGVGGKPAEEEPGIPPEEMPAEELGEEMPPEEMPEEAEELPAEEMPETILEEPAEPEEMPEEEAEELPADEMPEAIPEEPAEPEELPPETGEMAEESQPEVSQEPEAPAGDMAPETGEEPVDISDQIVPEEVIPAEPEEEDPRITRLREAYEAGKISKELYEKNLAKFKGGQ